MLLARYLYLKKPPRLFARHYSVKRIDPALVTFRPESLVALRPPPIDFSNFVSRSVLGVNLHYLSAGKFRRPRFPADSRGFLYYHPGSTALAGQLRLRICADASSFDAGHDLLVNDIQPWGPNLANLVRNPDYTPLVDQLVQEGLVSVDTVEIMCALLADRGVRPLLNILCTLSDPFYIHFDHCTSHLNIVTVKHISGYDLNYTFSTMPQGKRHRYPGPPISPFTGSVKVRFELSKLPEHASLGPTLVLKVLDVRNVRHVREDITIIKKPVAGEYHYRFRYGQMMMWRLCIDNMKGAREAFGPLLDMPGIVYAE